MCIRDRCIGNEEDAELCLGFKPEANVEAGETNAEGYKGIFKAMAKAVSYTHLIMKFTRNLSRMAHPWVRVAAIVVSEMNERLSPKKAPPTDMNLAFMAGIVVGGAFFGDNLSFLSLIHISYLKPNSFAIALKIPL